ncbi:MAG: hypothetical protein ACYDAL_08030 [Candidatus Dormibacteraceae bacterium]
MKDRKRSQRGSVLSGVLIITAFLAIIAGGLMTELSSSFLLSRALMHRVDNEATVNSAVELALNELQTTPVNGGCPAPIGASLNTQTAIATYLSCWPTVDARSLNAIKTPIVNSAEAFSVDGTFANVPGPGGSEYLIGDSGGTFYRFGFGQTTPWTVRLGGTVTGPALAMPDGRTLVIPVANSTAGPGCSTYCLALLTLGNKTPCYVQANGNVSGRPATGINYSNVAFAGDSSGSLFAYDTTGCSIETQTSSSQPVLALVAFKGTTQQPATDEVYVLEGDSSSSQLLHFSYSDNKHGAAMLDPVLGTPITLPPNPVGLAFDQTTLPARLALTFASGALAMVQIQTTFGMVLTGSGSVPANVADAPYWCHCPGPTDVIGVGGQNGTLYLLDANLNQTASISIGTPIFTSPSADRAGDWFVAADDGNLHEVPAVAATPKPQITFGSNTFGQVRSSVQLGSCGGWICAYVGSLNTNIYMVPLNARDAVLSAGITSSPANPHLWTNVEVGSASSPQTVHVLGWSYYSP